MTSLMIAVTRASGEVGHQFTSGLQRLATLRESKLATLFFFLWCLGIMGDGFSTYYVITQSNGVLVEGNSAAVVVMETFGLMGWVILAGLVCSAFMVLFFGRVTGMHSRAILVVASAVLLGKLYFAVSNYLLWLSYLRGF